jgi:hypothetical protein
MRTVTMEPRQTIPSSLGRLLPAFALGGQYRRAGWRNIRLFARNQFPYFAGMRTLIARFYNSIRNDTPPPIPSGEILRVSTMIDTVVGQLNGGCQGRTTVES